ncbi:MAG: glycosyltransferase [Beijerinckiaceae bacterium]|nr:glycosyltransferase [Beijerinckiaceae bacterium]
MRSVRAAQYAALPEAIAFLGSYGIGPGVLATAAAKSSATGVRPEQILLANGALSEEQYYAALARHLGLQFMDGPAELAPGAAFPQTITSGVAPLDQMDTAGHGRADTRGPAWLFAPEGQRLDELLILQNRRTLPHERFAITSPGHLRKLLFGQRQRQIADMTANALADSRSDLSAREAAGPAQKCVLLILATLLLTGLAAGGIYWLLLSLLAGSVLSGSIIVRLFAAAGSCDAQSREEILVNRTQQNHADDRDLPVYTIIVALYREAAVVRQLTAALNAIDYPAAKLDIKLVVEADDEDTQAALTALNLPARYQIIVLPPGKPRTKPRALNAALALAKGTYTCVFDAEDIPGPQQLREAAHVFDRNDNSLACLQGRLVIDNIGDSWLTRMFALEYAALFDVINPGLAWLRMPIPLGGTSNHFRTQVLRELHGWDAWNVTEDADLGLRLARYGYRVDTLASSTEEEAPATLVLWMRQRRRWIKGWMQTALVHSRNPRRAVAEMGRLSATIAFLHFAGALLGFMLGPLFAVATVWQIMWGNLLTPASVIEVFVSTCWCFVCLAGIGSALWPVLLGMKRRRLFGYAGWLMALPVYWLLQTLAAWWALWDLLRDPFHWHKTDHGIARTSRRKH